MTIEIQTWPVAKLVPYARALRRNDAAVDRMAAAIKEYNFILPLLVRSDGEIVDGHLRLKAARKLQITEVQVIVCDDWTPAQVKAFRLLINRSATWAKWDWKEVGVEIADLVNLNFDLTLTGFDAIEIDKLVLGLRGEDGDAPSPQAGRVPVSNPQDLWLCGPHRILCGDSTNAGNVARLFGESKPELMVTDAPYGVSYNPAWQKEAGLGKQRQIGKVVNDDRIDWSDAYKLFPGDVAYVWHAGIITGNMSRAGMRCGTASRRTGAVDARNPRSGRSRISILSEPHRARMSRRMR
jgi:ParB-like nuclease domain